MSVAPRRGAGEGTDLLRVATEVALWLLTVAGIVGMHRLFLDGSYRGALVLQAMVAHVVVTLLRRRGVRIVPAALITLGAGVLAVTWARFPETTAWGLPTVDTVRAVGDDVSSAWRLFGDVRAPAPVENGFVVTTAVAVWVIAFLADWAAFRVSAAFEALLPATVLFVFAAALGGPGSPVASAGLFAACALLFLLLHRTAAQVHRSRWSGGTRREGRWSLIATGVGLIGVTVIAGAVAGPRLPGADAEALVALQDLSQPDPTRVVVSPIVSLQTNLLEQPDVQVFTVRSDRSSYWRLTSLDEFDGELWRSSYNTPDADGELPREVDSAADAETVTQQVTINQLSAVWLPAAYEPRSIDPGPDEEVVYDPRSSTLMVDSDVASSDGYSYSVTSAMPDWTADELRTASDEVPDEIAERYLELPDDFPELAATEAFRITGDAPSPYDKALALQDYLRSDRFTYDREVGAGHSNEALLTFLFETRRGYCEQFAATFAALARSAGLPSRVAVGFTPGIRDSGDPTLYIVRGIHAHAWPEVYLGEYGWVPFEPTIDRGPPRGQSWLGLDEQQDTSTGGSNITDSEPLDGSGDGSGDGDDTSASGDDRREAGAGLGEDAVAAGEAKSGDDQGFVARVITQSAPTVGVAALAYLLLVPLAFVVQRVVRRRRARDPGARVELGWRTATDSALAAGVALPPWMTVAEKAERVADAFPGAAPEVGSLALHLEKLAYAEVDPTDDEARSAERDSSAVAAEARRTLPWWRRVLRYLDARRLLSTRQRARIVTNDPMNVTAL